MSQSSSVSGTVSKKGCRNGTYTTSSTSRSEAATAHTIQRLENTPIAKIEWYSERAVKARTSSDTQSVTKAMVCAASRLAG